MSIQIKFVAVLSARRGERVKNMVLVLLNNYRCDKHVVVDKVEDDFEYVGTDKWHGNEYDCYFVPDGNTYKAFCVKRS